MALMVAKLSYEAIEALRPLVPRIKRHDRSLADQLVRAASSVALNLAEGAGSDPGNRKARYFTALGSANEVRSTLQVANAVGLLPANPALDDRLDKIMATLWKLTR